MKAFRDFMRFYLVPLALMAGILLAAGFTMYYTFTARTKDGRTVAGNWPATFTAAFSRYVSHVGGAPEITDAGKALLDENGLWLQILDASGREVTSYRKPAEAPAAYRLNELLHLDWQNDGESTVCLGSITAGDDDYLYLIRFPIAISKLPLYVDTARYASGKALIFTVIALTAVLVIALTVTSYRSFRLAEKRRAQDERAKEEWLANITHDLKTPLSPIRGYAELLSEADAPPVETVRRYGAAIAKNAIYTEQLVDDLKLTYQLQSNMLPLQKERKPITRFVREVVIDILNAPAYEGRSINFLSDQEDAQGLFDPQLLRRALTNVIVNSLKHNPPDTCVAVAVAVGTYVQITVGDNGSGMTAQALDGLFRRYYRGAGAEGKAEGSGLGMAIAKQIVEAHGGSISAESQPGQGTKITLRLPG